MEARLAVIMPELVSLAVVCAAANIVLQLWLRAKEKEFGPYWMVSSAEENARRLAVLDRLKGWRSAFFTVPFAEELVFRLPLILFFDELSGAYAFVFLSALGFGNGRFFLSKPPLGEDCTEDDKRMDLGIRLGAFLAGCVGGVMLGAFAIWWQSLWLPFLLHISSKPAFRRLRPKKV